MNADEIVRALRSCSNHDTRKPDCDNCPLFGERLCVKKMLEGGVYLIESLQAQLADKTSLLDGAIAGQETLQRALTASQRRAQDARNELCLKCGRYREVHNGACDGCRWKE